MRGLVKAIVERNPALARSYRIIHDEFWWQRQKSVKMPLGFWLVGNKSMQNGEFEPEETEVLRNYISEADVFVDIGANIGYYTCLAQSLGKRTISVEPMSNNLRSLYKNLEKNGYKDVEIWPLGLAGEPGMLDIYGGGTGASLIDGWSGISSGYKQTIAVSTLDTILSSRLDGKRVMIKIDVEGAEFGVLSGAQHTLAMAPKPAWLVEITLTMHHPRANPRFAETFQMFWNQGYKAYTGDTNQRPVSESDVDRWVKDGKCDTNCFCWLFVPADDVVTNLWRMLTV
jgi:FkbM family methyltransferase